jgi:RHS repeat-associated protein
MGYYYTASPETAVPEKSCATPKTHTPGSPVKERGFRYYMPEIGRWTARDPIADFIGGNYYVFVANVAVCKFDILGLRSGDIPIIEGGDVLTAISELRTMGDRPHTMIPDFKDKKISGGVRRGTGFESCTICPGRSNAVYPCMAYGKWVRDVSSPTIVLPIWVDYRGEAVSDDQRRLWDQVLVEVQRHEQGHVDIFQTNANKLNWEHNVTMFSCDSYESACASAQKELAVAHDIHFDLITITHRDEQGAYQTRDIPATWRRIAELEAAYRGRR